MFCLLCLWSKSVMLLSCRSTGILHEEYCLGLSRYLCTFLWPNTKWRRDQKSHPIIVISTSLMLQNHNWISNRLRAVITVFDFNIPATLPWIRIRGFMTMHYINPHVTYLLTPRPVRRRISRQPKKKFGLASVDFAKLPAAGWKKSSAKPLVLPPTYWDLPVTTMTWIM